MATESDLPPNFAEDSVQMAKAAVLLVIGEPISPAHKDLILADVSKGFQSWCVDATGVDINDELAAIANGASAGEEGPEGERVIRRASPSVQVEILVNPQLSTVRMGLRTFLTTPSQHKHLIYAGHGFQGSGSWVLQDDVFTFTNFSQVFRDPDVENALKQQEGGTLSLHCFADGDWSNGNISKQDFGKILKVSVNPQGKLTENGGILQFVTYVSNFVEGRSLNKLLPASDVVGSIRFSKPTMYVFPGCQGDSALFGISGFNLLVNGGYNRKSCFWDFTRHLDRIDAMLVTHVGPDNLFGLASVLERKAIENIHPEIGYIYLNANEKAKHSPNGDLAPEEGGLLKGSSLKINLSEECSRLVEYCKQVGQFPHPCTRASKGDHQDPINLYHKVGHGSLDLYVLNPVQDSKEIKDFFQQWSKHAGQFGLNQGLPVQNVLSTCALLVWTPSSHTENITRIFFPGNAPQNKIIEGLEKVKHLDFLKHSSCSYRDLHAKPVKKGALSSKISRPTSAKPSTLSSPRESQRREKVEKIEKPKPTSSLKAMKGMKDDSNKKAVKEKKEKQKSPTKSSTNGTPASSTTGTPGKITPPVDMTPVATNLIDIQQSEQDEVYSGGSFAESEQNLLGQQPNELSEQTANNVAFGGPINNDIDSPEPLPDPLAYQPDSVLIPERSEETMAMVDEQVAMSKKTMEELGIYDDDAEFPEEVQEKAANVLNSIENDYDKTEDDEAEEDGGAFENDNPEAEEIQPEALPDPVAIPQCYATEPDVVQQQNADQFKREEVEDSFTYGQATVEQTAEGNLSDYGVEDSLAFEQTTAEDNLIGQQDAVEDNSALENNIADGGAVEDNLASTSKFADEIMPVADDLVLSQTPAEDNTTEEVPGIENQQYVNYESEKVNNSNLEESDTFDVQDNLPDDMASAPQHKVMDSFETENRNVTTPEIVEPLVPGENIYEDDQLESTPRDSIPETTQQLNDIDEQLITPEHSEEEKHTTDSVQSEEVNQFDPLSETLPQAKEESSTGFIAYSEENKSDSDEGIDAADVMEDPKNMQLINEDHSLSNLKAEVDSDSHADENTLHNRDMFAASDFPDENVEQAEESSIPAAFEKDETPELVTPAYAQAEGPTELQSPLTPDSGEVSDLVPSVDDQLQEFEQRGETDSLEGDPDNEKDVDETNDDDSNLLYNQSSESLQNSQDNKNPFVTRSNEISDTPNSQDLEQGGMNPFYGIEEHSGSNQGQETSESGSVDQGFNPLKEWGEPMGLPSPMLGDAPTNGTAEKSKAKSTKPAKNGVAKASDPKAPKKSELKKASTPNKLTSKTTDRKPAAASNKTAKAVNGDSKSPRSLTEKKAPTKSASTTEKKPLSRLTTRPATAPAKTENKKTNEKTEVSKVKTARRPASAAATKVGPPAIKTIPLPPVTTFYVDLTYIPAHGDPNYCDVEFFRRVRARHYVLSALSPTSHTLNALMEAKKAWEDKELEVTVIPTYDNETIRHWMGLHKEQLQELKIDVAPAASRCTIQLQDHETSCSAYRMEF